MSIEIARASHVIEAPALAWPRPPMRKTRCVPWLS